jgi:hypothetical protein
MLVGERPGLGGHRIACCGLGWGAGPLAVEPARIRCGPVLIGELSARKCWGKCARAPRERIKWRSYLRNSGGRLIYDFCWSGVAGAGDGPDMAGD